MKHAIHGTILLLIPLLFLLGCGKGGVQRFTVSGKVTFGGKPVPAGFVCFTPDTSKGNQGPQGYGKIINGHYSTEHDDQGSVSGPQVVEIRGFDGNASGELAALVPGRPLFPPYRTEVDIPEQAATIDFEIPANR